MDEVAVLKPVAGDRDGGDREDTLISLDAILPDDLLEKVLSFLPIASIIRSSSVCKRWYETVHSGQPSWAKMSPQKPWYFMFTCSDDAVSGYAYDPSLRKWYGFDFPCIEKSDWLTSSSCGLVCVMDSADWSSVFVLEKQTIRKGGQMEGRLWILEKQLLCLVLLIYMCILMNLEELNGKDSHQELKQLLQVA